MWWTLHIHHVHALSAYVKKLSQVEEYMEGGEQGPYAYTEEAYQAAQQMAVAAAANGPMGQYGAPGVHHDAQVCLSHAPHGDRLYTKGNGPLQGLYRREE